jgi:peroxiredoxin Q/BCP
MGGTLNVGDLAPDFSLQSSGGGVVSLSGLRGKTVVLYFYPKDDTPGCTKEACDFRDARPRFTGAGAVILGVSADSVASHDKFTAKYGLTFPLLSDPGAAVSNAYGVSKQKSMFGRTYQGIERTTFIIDPQGRIAARFPKVSVLGHANAVLEALRGPTASGPAPSGRSRAARSAA